LMVWDFEINYINFLNNIGASFSNNCYDTLLSVF